MIEVANAKLGIFAKRYLEVVHRFLGFGWSIENSKRMFSHFRDFQSIQCISNLIPNILYIQNFDSRFIDLNIALVTHVCSSKLEITYSEIQVIYRDTEKTSFVISIPQKWKIILAIIA